VEEVINRVMDTFGMMRSLNYEGFEESRASLTNYIEMLSSAGETDAHRLAVFGLAYLRELHDGPEPGFTGC
jgi:hypothetical protein